MDEWMNGWINQSIEFSSILRSSPAHRSETMNSIYYQSIRQWKTSGGGLRWWNFIGNLIEFDWWFIIEFIWMALGKAHRFWHGHNQSKTTSNDFRQRTAIDQSEQLESSPIDVFYSSYDEEHQVKWGPDLLFIMGNGRLAYLYGPTW